MSILHLQPKERTYEPLRRAIRTMPIEAQVARSLSNLIIDLTAPGDTIRRVRKK
jgi:hypothetical protein